MGRQCPCKPRVEGPPFPHLLPSPKFSGLRSNSPWPRNSASPNTSKGRRQRTPQKSRGCSTFSHFGGHHRLKQRKSRSPGKGNKRPGDTPRLPGRNFSFILHPKRSRNIERQLRLSGHGEQERWPWYVVVAHNGGTPNVDRPNPAKPNHILFLINVHSSHMLPPQHGIRTASRNSDLHNGHVTSWGRTSSSPVPPDGGGTTAVVTSARPVAASNAALHKMSGKEIVNKKADSLGTATTTSPFGRTMRRLSLSNAFGAASLNTPRGMPATTRRGHLAEVCPKVLT